MKIKIAIVYLLAFLVLFLTSCSEIIDTNAKELKANVWDSVKITYESKSITLKKLHKNKWKSPYNPYIN